MSNLVNIFSYNREIYLFERNDNGTLNIKKDSSFYPYFYEQDAAGEYQTYDNKKARKIVCSLPKEVKERKTVTSYEADVLYTKRYLIDKIDVIKKTHFKYFFLDIEILAKEFPDLHEAKDPISCITVYNSYTGEYLTWFLSAYDSEEKMLEEFMKYVYQEKPDVILGWNMENFDYPYLHNRIKDFPKKISPISQSRYGSKKENVFYPAGISILDYLTMFKRVYMREQSYALDRVAQKHLEEELWADTDFSTLSPKIKEKNINDVRRMVKLEQKYGILKYYDEIRRFAGCLWEDVIYNSMILDIFILREAKKRNLVLPNRDTTQSYDNLQGAYRRADIGVFYDVYKADVMSMYPNQLINFCLDAQNIRDIPEENCITIDNRHFKQNDAALLPSIARQLISQKDAIKQQLKEASDKEKDSIQQKYNAIKGLVNSLYGVMALVSFRLFNYAIASSITFLARDLLKYVEESMLKQGYKVHYTDTDALMYEAKKDEIELLNSLVKDWSIMTYNKPEIDIEFESEGKFTQVLILGKCHYYGYIEKRGELVKEMRGVEIKRSSSSKFESVFQEELINKILNKESKENILKWIKEEKERIKTLPLLDIAFPCKIANRKYKNVPIFVRAYKNATIKDSSFHLNKGELFYYIFTEDLGKDDNNKPINVMALTEQFQLENLREKIDWEEVIRRSMITKADAIFELLTWGSVTINLSNQTVLF